MELELVFNKRSEQIVSYRHLDQTLQQENSKRKDYLKEIDIALKKDSFR